MKRRYEVKVHHGNGSGSWYWVSVAEIEGIRVVFCRLRRSLRTGTVSMERPTPYLLLRADMARIGGSFPHPMGLEPTRAEEMAARRAFAAWLKR